MDTKKRIDIDWLVVDALMRQRKMRMIDLDNWRTVYRARRLGLRRTVIVEDLAAQLGVSPLRLLREVEEPDQSTIDSNGAGG